LLDWERETTLSAIQSVDCTTKKLDIRELAKQVLQEILLQTKVNINIDNLKDYTLDAVVSKCKAIYPPIICKVLQKNIEIKCSLAILSYSSNIGGKLANVAWGCFYILFPQQYQNYILCCTPDSQKIEVLKKLQQCNLAPLAIEDTISLCGKPTNFRFDIGKFSFYGTISRNCKYNVLSTLEAYLSNTFIFTIFQ
jgi:hypothetical protein